MSDDLRRSGPGPFLVDQLKPKDRYELSDGHAIYCAPTGGDGATGTFFGAQVIGSDPDVKEGGIDAGYTMGPGSLRAPDLSIGNVPGKPGFISGAPPLAVEYAGSGQDEADLKLKISELLRAGTRFVWVVRVVGPRRVEVYEPGKAAVVVGSGGFLQAPGVLRNDVPVAALFDPEAAHETQLRNLLQRKGYAGLDEVRAEGLKEGLETGNEQGRLKALRSSLATFLVSRKLGAPEEIARRCAAETSADRLEALMPRAAVAASLDEVFAP